MPSSIHDVPVTLDAPTFTEVGRYDDQKSQVFAEVLPSPFSPDQKDKEYGVTPAEMSDLAAPEDQSVGQLAAICLNDVESTGALVGNDTFAMGTMGFEIVHPFVAATGHV